ncbi:AraC family transcriptional regulator [Paenibacillus sp. HB172176]|uniref:helix-turn-helix transcriptional regulator n=1 Tax=Paenibacillus sp. HB172176 TaxID=2493690 RepID=UPI00143C607E|nr:AraC family transcriptional regulator [Paenibacillus sp. HB172176]
MVELFGAGFDDRNPGWRKPLEKTPNYALALIISGKLSYRINNVVLHLKKGDLLFIPMGSMREGFHTDEIHPHQKYWATFTIPRREELRMPMLGQSEPCVIKSREYDYMKQRLEQLIGQWMGKLPYFEDICSGILLDLLGRMNRELDEGQHPSPVLGIVTRIQEYVLAHYREDIRVDRLAELVHRSPNYVSASFKKLTGQTPKSYIHQVKVSAARDLIIQHHVTIGEASEYVGFCDQAYFNRIFKKIYGYPPSQLYLQD